MFESAPNGYFLNDLIVFHGLGKGCIVSKGFLVEPPELSTAAPEHSTPSRIRSRSCSRCLHEKLRLQVQWFCDSDYRAELLRYHEQTERRRTSGPAARATSVSRATGRPCRSGAFAAAPRALLLRKIDIAAPAGATGGGLRKHYEVVLQQLGSESRSSTRCSGKSSTARASSQWRCRSLPPHLALPESVARRAFDFDPLETFVPELSIQENCWHSEANGLPEGAASGWTATIIPSSSCTGGQR